MIPDFLKRENIPNEKNGLMDALKRYRDHFGTTVTTECSSFNSEEWIEILNNCIENDKPYEDYFESVGKNAYI